MPVLGSQRQKILALVHVPGGQVVQGFAALLFVLDPGRACGSGPRVRWCALEPDGGLLVGGDDIIVPTEPLTVPFSGVEVQHPAGFGFEVGVAREDPRSVAPGADGIFGQPPPDRGPRYFDHDATGADLGGDVGSCRRRRGTPKREGSSQQGL
jgi:hypothetical protein